MGGLRGDDGGIVWLRLSQRSLRYYCFDDANRGRAKKQAAREKLIFEGINERGP